MIKRLRFWTLMALAMSVMTLPGCAASAGAAVVINETAVPPAPTLNPDRAAQGEQLYAQHCASCHGANLEGAPDWKRPLEDGSLPPPPHDSSGHTWHHTDSLLITIIAKGGQAVYDNAKMPAFGGQLTEDEIVATLDFIKSKWGKDEREFQWWITYTGGE